MKRCSYFAWWFWLEVKALMAADVCGDGPWCGCDQHRAADGDDDGDG